MEQLDTMSIAGYKVAYRPRTSDEEVINDTFNKDIFFKGFPEYKIQPDHVVLDIGAHIGTYSLQLASFLPAGKVFAFEPCLDTFSLLEKNVEINGLKNVSIYKVALTDYVGTTKLFYDIEHGNWGHSIVKSFSEQGEIVETNTLSNFLTGNNIEHCDFIKFNCEGAEFKIILSTPPERLRKVDKMLVLYHMDLEAQFTVKDLIRHLHKAGFYTEIRNIEDAGKRGWLIVMRANTLQKTLYATKFRGRQISRFSARVVNKLKRMAGLKK
jgi:FkbM family methyltransferase